MPVSLVVSVANPACAYRTGEVDDPDTSEIDALKAAHATLKPLMDAMATAIATGSENKARAALSELASQAQYDLEEICHEYDS